jgi:hypothetical protein
MKETAIEWLLEELNNGRHLTDRLIEQAKEMEKKQIMDAYQQGFNNAYFSNPLTKEQYYKEQFKNK